MIDTAVKPPLPAAARTRLMLEGPIVPTLLRLAVPNLVVNVVLIAVTTSVCRLVVVVLGGWIAIEVLHAGLVGLGVITALGLATWGLVLAGAFRFYAHLR